jgi:hypothetical protein
MKLQAWGLELDDRIHGVLLACEPHAAVAKARATAWSDIDPTKPRWVRLEHLDANFVGSAWKCFACQLGTESRPAVSQDWAKAPFGLA